MNSPSATSQEDNGICGSDSDSNPDDLTDYYQPISTADNSGGEDSDDGGRDPNSNFHQLPNGWMENGGVSSLNISDDDADEDAEKEVEEATESEMAIERAFKEDEMRRNAPPTADNAGRVMDAMRRISFGGGAPDWAGEIPEDQWIGRLRRLRSPSSAASAVTSLGKQDCMAVQSSQMSKMIGTHQSLCGSEDREDGVGSIENIPISMARDIEHG